LANPTGWWFWAKHQHTGCPARKLIRLRRQKLPAGQGIGHRAVGGHSTPVRRVVRVDAAVLVISTGVFDGRPIGLKPQASDVPGERGIHRDRRVTPAAKRVVYDGELTAPGRPLLPGWISQALQPGLPVCCNTHPYRRLVPSVGSGGVGLSGPRPLVRASGMLQLLQRPHCGPTRFWVRIEQYAVNRRPFVPVLPAGVQVCAVHPRLAVGQGEPWSMAVRPGSARRGRGHESRVVARLGLSASLDVALGRFGTTKFP